MTTAAAVVVVLMVAGAGRDVAVLPAAAQSEEDDLLRSRRSQDDAPARAALACGNGYLAPMLAAPPARGWAGRGVGAGGNDPESPLPERLRHTQQQPAKQRTERAETDAVNVRCCIREMSRGPRVSHSALAGLGNADWRLGWRKWVWAFYEIVWGIWWSLFKIIWRITTHDFFRGEGHFVFLDILFIQKSAAPPCFHASPYGVLTGVWAIHIRSCSSSHGLLRRNDLLGPNHRLKLRHSIPGRMVYLGERLWRGIARQALRLIARATW